MTTRREPIGALLAVAVTDLGLVRAANDADPWKLFAAGGSRVRPAAAGPSLWPLR
jgi:hypothetical protein